jgi:hypothetical protein
MKTRKTAEASLAASPSGFSPDSQPAKGRKAQRAFVTPVAPGDIKGSYSLADAGLFVVGATAVIVYRLHHRKKTPVQLKMENDSSQFHHFYRHLLPQ